MASPQRLTTGLMPRLTPANWRPGRTNPPRGDLPGPLDVGLVAAEVEVPPFSWDDTAEIAEDPGSAGRRDGRNRIPSTEQDGEPPYVAVAKNSAAASAAELTHGFLRQVMQLQQLKASAEDRLELAKQRYLEALERLRITSHLSDLRPYYRDLEDAEKAVHSPGPTTVTGGEIEARRLSLDRWYVKTGWFVAASAILLGIEVPVTYVLAASLVRLDNRVFEGIVRWTLAISVAGAIFTMVKVAGIYLRRWTLYDEWAEERRANDKTDGAGLERKGNGIIRKRCREGVKATIAIGCLIVTGVALSYFRATEWSERLDFEETAELAKSLKTVEASASSAEFVPTFSPWQVGVFFGAIFTLTMVAGVMLAWMSSDPERDSRAKDHSRAEREVELLRRQLTELITNVRQVDIAINSLGESLKQGRTLIEARRDAVISQYWDANLSERREPVAPWLFKELPVMEIDDTPLDIR